MIKLGNQPTVVLLLGFDCDRPRDAFIISKEGSEMAERKSNSIIQISNVLNELKLPRTFFVCIAKIIKKFFQDWKMNTFSTFKNVFSSFNYEFFISYSI